MEELIKQQNEILLGILSQMQKQQKSDVELGFAENTVRPRYVYCNRTNNCLWYWLNDAREVVPITQPTLTGFVQKLEFKEVERRGKQTWKMHLHVRADRLYILEAGYESIFTKGLLSAIASMSSQQLKNPVLIEAKAADSEEVLFCQVYESGRQVYAPWDENTDWKSVAGRAVEVVNAANA